MLKIMLELLMRLKAVSSYATVTPYGKVMRVFGTLSREFDDLVVLWDGTGNSRGYYSVVRDCVPFGEWKGFVRAGAFMPDEN